MDYLVFDTETTGLPTRWDAPVSDVDNWPRLVQLAWVLYDGQGHEIKSAGAIIRPEGFTIPYDSTRIHGISTEQANRAGVSILAALSDFVAVFKNKDVTLVAHNLEYDLKVMGAELFRHRIGSGFLDLPKMCTMRLSTNFCALPNNKPPRLAELYQKLFGTALTDAHHAAADTRACGACFFELRRQGVIVEPSQPVQRMLL
ncbi:MAG: 3'-5' exonuclease [Patescibacteria group bacterium]